MKRFILVCGLVALLAFSVSTCADDTGKTWKVPSGVNLPDAMDMAQPGDTISLEAGTYDLLAGRAPELAQNVTIQGAGAEKTIIIGELRANGGITLRDLTLIDSEDTSQEYTPALRSRGSLVLERVLVQGDGKSSVLTTGSQEGNKPLLIQVVNSRFESRGGTALTVDVPMADNNSKIEGNVFEGHRLGIDLSIDVVFGETPLYERMAEFEKAVADLQKVNTFIEVETPVSGGRG